MNERSGHYSDEMYELYLHEAFYVLHTQPPAFEALDWSGAGGTSMYYGTVNITSGRTKRPAKMLALYLISKVPS
jgi:hypothetical protein